MCVYLIMLQVSARAEAAEREAAARGEGVCPQFTILLLLTDGVIMDMDKTREAIVRASRLPLSIVIVGVGPADFGAMELLDSDDSLLTDARGNRAARDIVQFVPLSAHFNSYKNTKYNASQVSTLQGSHQFSAEVLHEIPGQVVDYFVSRNIVPDGFVPYSV